MILDSSGTSRAQKQENLCLFSVFSFSFWWEGAGKWNSQESRISFPVTKLIKLIFTLKMNVFASPSCCLLGEHLTYIWEPLTSFHFHLGIVPLRPVADGMCLVATPVYVFFTSNYIYLESKGRERKFFFLFLCVYCSILLNLFLITWLRYSQGLRRLEISWKHNFGSQRLHWKTDIFIVILILLYFYCTK